MSFVAINNTKGGAPDGRVDRLVQDTTVTREDIGQVVAWLQDVEEKVAAFKIPEPAAPVDEEARNQIDALRHTQWVIHESLTVLESRFDVTADNVSAFSSQIHAVTKDVDCLQAIVKRLQEQPPQQTVQVYHNHTYTPESHRLLWWAVGFTFLIGALSYVI